MAGNSFATVGATLGLDITPFEQGLAKSSASVDKFGGKLASKMMGPRAVMGSLATALGIGFSHIADSVARIWSGMTEVAEQYYKDIEELSSKAADMQIEDMMAVLDTAKQLALLQGELRRIQNGGGETAKPREASWYEKLLLNTGLATPTAMWGEKIRDARLEENKVAAQRAQYINQIRSLEIKRKIRTLEEKAQKEDQDRFTKQIEELMQKNEWTREAAEARIKQMEREAEAQDKINEAVDKQVAAQKALNAAIDERSTTTLSDLASNTQLPGRVQAREIQRLEERAKWRRASGFAAGAEQDINKALELRKALGILPANERDPLAQEMQKIEEASRDYLKAIADALKAKAVNTADSKNGNGQGTNGTAQYAAH